MARRQCASSSSAWCERMDQTLPLDVAIAKAAAEGRVPTFDVDDEALAAAMNGDGDAPPEFAFDDDDDDDDDERSDTSSVWSESEDGDDGNHARDVSASEDDGSETETESIDASELPNWLKSIKDGGGADAAPATSVDEFTDAAHREPPKTRNEIEREAPTTVPVIESDEAIAKIGRVASVVGSTVVIQTFPATTNDDADPLDEDSVLCLGDRRGLGVIEEVFGPVSAPLYSTRLPSKEQCADAPDVRVGDDAFVVLGRSRKIPTKGLYRKGYDASGKDDEEVEDDGEFSDDEAEAEAKRANKPPGKKRSASARGKKAPPPPPSPMGGGGMFGMRGLPRPPPPPPPPSMAMGQMGIHQGQPMMMVPVSVDARGQPVFVMPQQRPPPPPPPPKPQ